MHVPNTGPLERERQQRIRQLEAALRRFERLPRHRREAECADIGEHECRMLLAELGAPGYQLSNKLRTVELLSLDAFLDSLGDETRGPLADDEKSEH